MLPTSISSISPASVRSLPLQQQLQVASCSTTFFCHCSNTAVFNLPSEPSVQRESAMASGNSISSTVTTGSLRIYTLVLPTEHLLKEATEPIRAGSLPLYSERPCKVEWRAFWHQRTFAVMRKRLHVRQPHTVDRDL